MSRTAQLLTRPSRNALRWALDPPLRRVLDAAIAAAEAEHAPLWAVGGPVRDLAVGLPVRDLDLATDRPAQLAARVAATLDGRAHEEPRFGTGRVSGTHRGVAWHLDLAALRNEHYVRPGALPTVQFGATIEADLARRDFTVNAVALALTTEAGRGVVDPFDGLDDLAARRLRVLHAGSFRDDATRLWRAARFAARLRLRPDTATVRLIREGVQWLPAISSRRLWREFTLVAAEERAAAAVGLLDRWGILAATHPALALDEVSRAALRRVRGSIAPEILCALLLATRFAEGRAAGIVRLGAPRGAVLAVEDAARLLALPRTAPPDVETLDAAARTSEAGRGAALLLAPTLRTVLAAAEKWGRTRPHLAPAEVVALGIAPGPRLGAVLAELRRARYVGTLRSASTARLLVRRWAAEGDSPTSERTRT